MNFSKPSHTDVTIHSLLNGNTRWQQKHSSSFFKRHAQEQTPDALFISCSDSRVSPSEISQSSIGKLFEFRNIANLALPKDQSLQAVVHYAVSNLRIKHIIICGHYGCGGIKAAMEIAEKNLSIEPALFDWLQPIVTLYKANKATLSQIADPEKRYKKLVELNVIAQMRNLENSPFIQQAKQSNDMGIPIIQGAVYELSTGKLSFLSPPSKLSCALALKEKIELQIERLERQAMSNNPFLRKGAHDKCMAIQTALDALSNDDLLIAINQTDSDLYQALNKKRTLPFSFIGIKQGVFFSHKSQSLLSLQSTEAIEYCPMK